MITGINLNETEEFVSQFDKSDPKTIFTIGPIDSIVQAMVGARATNESDALNGMIEAFRFGVKNIKNSNVVYSQTTKLLSGTYYKIVNDETLKVLPIKIITDVAARIIKISNLSEDEQKN